MGHEVRTPLNTITLGLELLETELTEAKAPPSTMDTVQALRESGLVAVDILNELLLYEKIEAGIMALDASVVLFKPLLEATIRPFQISARSKGVSMTLRMDDCGSRLMGVEVDESKIAQVIRNFVSNAIKFTPQGGEVTVTLTYVTNQRLLSSDIKNWLRLEVKDTGHGIAPENQHKVFNQIVQFHANKQQGGGGSGIGLWISKKIVELHGGKVGLQSEGEGKGCTFFLELPLHDVVEIPHSSAEEDFLDPLPPMLVVKSKSVKSHFGGDLVREADSPFSNSIQKSIFEESWGSAFFHSPVHSHGVSSGDASTASPKAFKIRSNSDVAPDFATMEVLGRILVVDDSGLNRKITSRSLTACGYECVEAVDGQAAVEIMASALREGPNFSVILLDNLMPRLNGEEAAKAIRELGFTGFIIGVTGNGMPDDIASFRRHGANDVIVKPMNMDKFDAVMSRLLRQNAKNLKSTRAPQLDNNK